tara:strand:- start:28035 stop:28493 length:459 start_codon:yes stop_codon:yes gene_type:complete
MGNICRSPAAEGVFQHKIAESDAGEQVSCDSAGTLDYHAGEPADPRMRRSAQSRGYELTSIARGFQVSDFDRFDWIVTMDNENFQNIVRLAPDSSAREKVRPFCDWVDLPGVSEVPDPYYGGGKGFEQVLDILENGSHSLLNWVLRGDGSSR